MEYKKIVDEQEEYVIGLRREFHMHPETSWNEFRTSRRIKQELDKMGIEWTACANTGVVGIIRGSAEGKTVALRADMDALEITEKNEVPYRSKTPGVMHACGHDGHAAMLLGAAKALNTIRYSIAGNIMLIFQPAEEMVQGAKKIIEEGAIDDIDGIMGIHLWNDIPVGKINIESGPRMASADCLAVEFYRGDDHSAGLYRAANPAYAAAAFIMSSNSILSREKNPMDSVTFTIGKMESGTKYDCIPEKSRLEGTLRCFSETARKKAIKAISRHAKTQAALFGAIAKADIKKVTPATINEKSCSSIARRSAAKIVGEKNLIRMEKTTGSEDMSYYLERIPGIIAFVGSGAREGNYYPHHHPKFDIEEESLNLGCKLYFNFALDFLNENREDF